MQRRFDYWQQERKMKNKKDNNETTFTISLDNNKQASLTIPQSANKEDIRYMQDALHLIFSKQYKLNNQVFT